jgi:predicted nuclease with TOPRIM domain
MEAEHEIQARIAEVEAEQHRLRIRSVEVHGLDAEERARLKALEVELDQLWDQIRRFRAGASDAEELRPAREVEGYLQ